MIAKRADFLLRQSTHRERNSGRSGESRCSGVPEHDIEAFHRCSTCLSSWRARRPPANPQILLSPLSDPAFHARPMGIDKAPKEDTVTATPADSRELVF